MKFNVGQTVYLKTLVPKRILCSTCGGRGCWIENNIKHYCLACHKSSGWELDLKEKVAVIESVTINMIMILKSGTIKYFYDSKNYFEDTDVNVFLTEEEALNQEVIK